jgi:hypothetical protein
MTKALDNFRIKKRWGKFIQFATVKSMMPA